MNLNSIDLAPQGSWAEIEAALASAGPGSDSTAEKPREFEKLIGARWINSDTRESGEFVVIHGGSEHRFRLYFIDLPPTAIPISRYGKAELSRHAKQLRTTEDKLLRFGKKVDDGLRDAVWTEDLTIYTRWETRGREGASLAYIMVGDTPLSLSLVEKGHARVGRAFAAQAPFIGEERGTAKTYLRRLRAAELAAKQSRRGLWGL
jgi:endonuclease YncB( thermonuclease family)